MGFFMIHPAKAAAFAGTGAAGAVLNRHQAAMILSIYGSIFLRTGGDKNAEKN